MGEIKGILNFEEKTLTIAEVKDFECNECYGTRAKILHIDLKNKTAQVQCRACKNKGLIDIEDD